MIGIVKTTVEYTKNPIGITKTPRISWVLRGDQRDTFQESYEIEIAKDPNFETTVYIKKETGRQSLHHVPDGFCMESMQKYYYRIRVTDHYGETSAYCRTAEFTTAFLNPKEWKAVFVTAEKQEDANSSRGTYVRKQFQTNRSIRHAYACTTALGLYQFFINGSRVGTDEMTPGWTSYHKHLLYQMYDVTALLKEAKNGGQCIGAMLGAGWYKGKMGFLNLRNNYGDRTAFLCQLHIVYEDGSSEDIVTDHSWQGADAPVLFSEIYDGEIYDARCEIEGWCKGDSKEDDFAKKCRPVELIEADKKILTSQPGCKVTEMTRVPARELIVTPQGDTVIDFGQNMAGWIHVKVHGNVGDKVELNCFETLDKDGNVYLENLRSAKNSITYYCKGTGEESYHPHFSFQGFRYARAASWPGTLHKEDVTAYALHSDMERTGYFSCSNPGLNQLWSNILWGLKSNFIDVPTDCPQRDERVGWTGDAQIFCRTASFLMNTYLFFEKWLLDVAADQTPEGGVPHVVPDIITPGIEKSDNWLLSQGTHSAAAWADAAVLNPWNLYLTFGDKQILLDQYESMKAWIRFMETHAKGVIWNYQLQFGDWVALDAEEGSYYGATPNDLTCTAYYAYSTGIFARIAGILGRTRDEAYFKKLEQKIKEGFAEHFFDQETKGMTVQTQTAHIIALYFGLTPEVNREQTVKELLELLEKENGHLVTGFVGTPYFTHALSRNGHLKEAYALLMKDDFPSWLYQVKQGATTIWEHWDGKKPDGSMWSADMNSFNHYAYGAIGEWMYRVITGIEIDEKQPGYAHTLLYPRPGGGLTWAEGKYESMYGTVGCSWKQTKDGYELKCLIPVNTTASIRFDGIDEVLDADGLSYRLEEGSFRASAGSGSYHIYFRAKAVV